MAVALESMNKTPAQKANIRVGTVVAVKANDHDGYAGCYAKLVEDNETDCPGFEIICEGSVNVDDGSKSNSFVDNTNLFWKLTLDPKQTEFVGQTKYIHLDNVEIVDNKLEGLKNNRINFYWRPRCQGIMPGVKVEVLPTISVINTHKDLHMCRGYAVDDVRNKNGIEHICVLFLGVPQRGKVGGVVEKKNENSERKSWTVVHIYRRKIPKTSRNESRGRERNH
jgi:hypothetical protein